jgi:hypothetical protein
MTLHPASHTVSKRPVCRAVCLFQKAAEMALKGESERKKAHESRMKWIEMCFPLTASESKAAEEAEATS